LCAAILAQACSDSTSPSRGTLTGTVVLEDGWANRIGDDFSGVAVSVDGMSTGAVTDTSGAWHIDSVPAGNHDITFKKVTFGTVVLAGQAVAGPSTAAPDIVMALTPWQQAIIDSIYIVTRLSKDYYVVDGHLSAPPPANARFGSTVAYFGRTATVSPDPSSFDQWNSGVDPTGKSSKFSISLPADAMRSTFGVGAHIFAVAYVSATACTCYPDNPTAKPFFSNTGPRANVVQLTVK
jgi:hypothetical protein